MKKKKIIIFLFMLSLLFVPFSVLAAACENISSAFSCSYTSETSADCTLTITPQDTTVEGFDVTLNGATLKSVSSLVESGSPQSNLGTGQFLSTFPSISSQTEVVTATIDDIIDPNSVTLSNQQISYNTAESCTLDDITASFENGPVAAVADTSEEQTNPHTANENIAYIGLLIVALGIVGLIVLNKKKLKI